MNGKARVEMNYHVMTLFPEMVLQGLNTSIIGRAIDKGLISLNAINIRDFSEDKHKKVDDYPYGGGAGMVMNAEPVYKTYGFLTNHIKLTKEDPSAYHRPRVIYVTPQGSIFNQEMAEEFAKEEDLIFLCGHYEGIDERVLEMIVTDHVSIGDYVLTGGELPAMVMIDAISRLIPGVLNNDISSEFESFQDNLLEYPQYTRPENFMGHKVPEVLLTGHHANIEAWRRQQSILRTYERRPDLLENADLSEEEREYLTRLIFQKNFDVY
jgi:tRNA (guanine37-N1)-methyltransferase